MQDRQSIKIYKINKDLKKKRVNYLNTKIEKIRVVKGTNFNYFSETAINDFFISVSKPSSLPITKLITLNPPEKV